MPFGPKPVDQGTRFSLWAPDVETVTLVGQDLALPMARDGSGWFSVTTPLDPGASYGFQLPSGLVVPDPASRAQQQDVHGPSLVPSPIAADSAWRGRAWAETVLYELHVGTFTDEGTLAAAARELSALASLGITAVELMPLAAYSGRRGWGYDGVLPYAVHASYGTPDDLASFVAEAHRHGLMVILDVVYNHFGPDGNYLASYAKGFFRDDINTPWGPAIDFRRPEVRAFVVENALYWLDTFGIDGLRLDAVHAIHDTSEPHILEEISAAVRERFAGRRHVHLMLENDDNNADLLEHAYDAQWNDDHHHAAHVVATGEADGYYVGYTDDPVGLLLKSLSSGFVYQGDLDHALQGRRRGQPSGHLRPQAFVDFIQNHDQIGNRAMGERLTVLAPTAAVQALQALLLLAPPVPMLFMGEEWGARTPFLFFCDFEGALADAVREGRRAEFARFKAFADPVHRERIPDPLDPATMAVSRLDRGELQKPAHAAWRATVQEQLDLRHRLIVPGLAGMAPDASIHRVGDCGFIIAWWLADGRILELQANLGERPLSGFPPPTAEVVWASPGTVPSGDVRPAWSVVAAVGAGA